MSDNGVVEFVVVLFKLNGDVVIRTSPASSSTLNFSRNVFVTLILRMGGAVIQLIWDMSLTTGGQRFSINGPAGCGGGRTRR